MKSDGTQATDAMMDTIKTVVGTEPKNGFTSDATYSAWLALVFLFSFCVMIDATYSSTKRIRHACQRCRPYASPLSEPHVTVSRRRCQYKGLRQSCYNLAHHDDCKVPSFCRGACISNPVPYQE